MFQSGKTRALIIFKNTHKMAFATHLHFFYVAHIRVKQYKIKNFYFLMKDHEENFEDTVHG